jgi:hypothetical protein
VRPTVNLGPGRARARCLALGHGSDLKEGWSYSAARVTYRGAAPDGGG